MARLLMTEDKLKPFYRRNGSTWPLLAHEYAAKSGISAQAAHGRLQRLVKSGLVRSTRMPIQKSYVTIYEVVE